MWRGFTTVTCRRVQIGASECAAVYLPQDARFVTGFLERPHDGLRVLMAARLEHELDGRLDHVQVDALAPVRDVDDVRAGRGNAGEQGGERAGAVGDPCKQTEPAARLGLVATRD